MNLQVLKSIYSTALYKCNTVVILYIWSDSFGGRALPSLKKNNQTTFILFYFIARGHIHMCIGGRAGEENLQADPPKCGGWHRVLSQDPWDQIKSKPRVPHSTSWATQVSCEVFHLSDSCHMLLPVLYVLLLGFFPSPSFTFSHYSFCFLLFWA